MRINLNSPDGNIFIIFGKIYDILREQYTEKEIKTWLNSVVKRRNYEQIIEKIQEDWSNFKNVENLEFYKSEKYEMEKENLCI